MTSQHKQDTFRSAIYVGDVRHRRFTPLKHEFSYPLFMLALDLDELPSLMKTKWYMGTSWFHPIRFKRSDFYNPEQSDLKQAVINRVQQEFAQQGYESPVIDRVVLITHLRYFNFTFNPVSFYYCFDNANKLIAIQAEITNTPWKERHSYVLPVAAATLQTVLGQSHNNGLKVQSQNQPYSPVHYHCIQNNPEKPKHEFCFSKQFHVSPFNPMNMNYRWVFSNLDETLLVHMDNTMEGKDINNEKNTIKHFDATLVMNRKNIQQQLAKTLIRYPLMTVTVVVGIYWQAMKLYVKRAPFYSHPKHDT